MLIAAQGSLPIEAPDRPGPTTKMFRSSTKLADEARQLKEDATSIGKNRGSE